MNSPHVNFGLIGNPEVPYESRYCPECGLINWVAGRNPFSAGSWEPEWIKCWKCNTIFAINGSDTIRSEEDFETELAEGSPDPIFTTEILYNLVFAAKEQLQSYQEIVIKYPEDNALLELIDNVSASINFVLFILGEEQVLDIKKVSDE